MPWSRLETRAENERKRAEEKAQVEGAREERLAGLQHRLDQFAGEVDDSIAWAGLRALHQIEDHVRVPTEALEKLLDRAEGKG